MMCLVLVRMNHNSFLPAIISMHDGWASISSFPCVFSAVAPICYAHLAAAQMGTVMKFEDMSLSETSSSHGGITTPGAVPVPPMPKLNPEVASSMFFC